MGKVTTQDLLQRAADPDGFSLNQNYTADQFIVLDGALATTNPYSGDAEINFEGDGSLGVLVGFTTGATGSVADVTIIGRDIYNNPVTEVVTMPGAAGAVSSTTPMLFIESMQIDDVATNLSVGIIAADAQYGPWIAWDHHQGHSEVSLQIEVVSGTVNYTVEHTLQSDLLRNGYDGTPVIDEATPFGGATATAAGILNGPFVGSRVRVNSGTAAVLRLRWLYSGSGAR